MTKKFELELDKVSKDFSSYFDILNMFPQFREFQREIKINTILTEKRIQFDIEDVKLVSIIGTIGKIPYPRLNEYSFKIKSMSFILNNLMVERLELEITTLNDESEKIISSDIPLSMKINYLDGKIPTNGHFYLEIKNPSN